MNPLNTQKKDAKDEKLKQESPVSVAPDLSNTVRRLRMLEERHTKTQNRIRLLEENMINSNKKINVELKTLSSEIDEMKRDVAEIKDRILLIVRELKLCAKHEEVNVLKKYVELWEPLHFVTREEVEKMIKSALERKF